MDNIQRDAILIAMRDAKTLDPEELRNASEFADDVWAEFNRVDEGMVLPWEKTHDSIKLRPGELSIWAGINGHGKSTVVGHITAHLATHGYRCCVASMEWRTPVWLMRMQRQIGGLAKPTEAYSRHISASLRETLWTFDVAGKSKASRILDVFRYARRRYRIELFVIDNLTKCGFADDDYAGQKQFVEALADFARMNDCHVLLVAHMRKSESEDKPVGKMSVKGSGGITDMAPTVVEVWRNKARERAIYNANSPDDPIPLAEKYLPDGSCGAGSLLLVHKQNATGKEPVVKLWLDDSSTQFMGNANHRPRAMLPFSVISNTGEISA